MTIRMRSFFLLILPAFFLLNPRNTLAAAPTPTAERKPGVYLGTINMTIRHYDSQSVGQSSTSFYIDMINSTGSMEIQLLTDGRNYLNVDLPVPIDFKTEVDVKDDKAECKGYTVTGAAYGKAKGTTISMSLFTMGSYTISAMTFGLSSLDGSFSPKGKCPVKWKEITRQSISTDFVNVFGSGYWSFTASSAGYAAMSGTCENDAWGKGKGQSLECSWRVFRVSDEPVK